MNYQLNQIILFLLLTFIVSCTDHTNEVSTNIYHWENNGLMHTTYFYEIENNTANNLIINFYVEATCEDGTVYSNEQLIKVSKNKKRKSSSFFSTDGKNPIKMDIVDIKTRINPF